MSKSHKQSSAKGEMVSAMFSGAIAILTLVVIPISSQASQYSTAMYFHSQVRDAQECADNTTTTSAGIGFDSSISNPAATCPDATAWKQMLDTIKGQFWTQWANDETLWVTNPKTLCEDSRSNDCCFVDVGGTPQVGYRDASGAVVEPVDIGGPGEFCPYIPADWGGAAETSFAAGKSVSSHSHTFLNAEDPGRVARQQEAEIVYRNDSFMRYATSADIYSRAGLQKQFVKVAGEAAHSAPYRPTGQGISFPTDAVMFKTDWIPKATMIQLGYITDHDNDPNTPEQNADNPYITMQMRVSTGEGKPYRESLHYLAAITGASKALPNWHWYAFEHVANKGRCDFTGCNDSFGYKTTVQTLSPASTEKDKKQMTVISNFVTPLTMSDELKDGEDLFDLGKAYPSGDIQPALEAWLDASGVAGGSPSDVNPDMPQISDPAWASYRLKGTQTQYYNRDGYPTIVGASITEGGFVNTASCLSCHVQASVANNPDLKPPPSIFGVKSIGFSGRLNLFGIGEVVSGAPYIGDYYGRGTTNQTAVQTDFVWGAAINAN